MNSVSRASLQQNTAAWTPERVETLTKLWGKGWSAGQITAELPGFSRNAVIGKIDRLKLTRDKGPRKPSSQRPSKLAPRATPERVTPFRPAPVPDEVPVETSDGVGIQLFELTNTTCRWPKGTPGHEGFCFCGAHGANFTAGKPYCRAHAAKARR